MKTISTLVLVIARLILIAQDDIVKNNRFTHLDTIDCQNNQVLNAQYWEVYQTENDRWDGERDTSSCYTFRANEYQGFISNHDFDLRKMTFLRYNPDTLATLLPNTIYGAAASAYHTGFSWFDENCEDRDCSGLLIQLQVPDSTGDASKIEEFFDSYIDQSGEFCFATDRYSPVKLKEFIFQFKWSSPRPDTIYLWAEMEKVEYQGIVNNTWIEESKYTGEQYLVEHSSLNTDYNYAILLLNQDTLNYPSPANIYYEDLQLTENKPTPQEIVIHIFGSLLFQSFAQLRGGLVQGSDTLRHRISYYIPDWGSFCLYHIAEVIMEDGGELILDNGKVNFFDKNACLQFSKGSNLVVPANAQTILGNRGNGILALRSGGGIILKENSSLTLDLQIEMHELKGELQPQNIIVQLAPGAELSFTDRADLSNQYSIDQQMKMFVYLKGGQVDLTKLSAHERSLIVIIDESEMNPKTEWMVFPNPTKSHLQIINSQKSIPEVIQIFDSSGQRISTPDKMKSEINISNLTNGIYYLLIKNGDKMEVHKFIKD